jgi:hypothetical protein
LPNGVVALSVGEPEARLETSVVCRANDPSPTLAAFVEVARGVFDIESVLS